MCLLVEPRRAGAVRVCRGRQHRFRCPAAASGAEELVSATGCEEGASTAAASGVAAKGVPGVERIAQRNSSNDHGPIRMTRARVVVDLACVLVAFA